VYHLSCGHIVDSMDDSVAVTHMDYTKEGSRAVAYKNVCCVCFQNYKKENTVFYSDNDAMKWLLNA
jgi:hypothetical protein